MLSAEIRARNFHLTSGHSQQRLKLALSGRKFGGKKLQNGKNYKTIIQPD